MLQDQAYGRAAVVEIPAQDRDIREERGGFAAALEFCIRYCLYTVYECDRLFAELSPIFFILSARKPLDHRAPFLFVCGKKLLCWSCNFLPSRAKSRDWFTQNLDA